jgi:tetratricopeptide (TPR) repeat protein
MQLPNTLTGVAKHRLVSLSLLLVLLAGVAAAQSNPSGQSAPAQAPSAGASPAAPAGPPPKTPPQAKTQEEYNAYLQAEKAQDGVTAEKAADDFAAKFKTSDLRALLYYRAMTIYQGAHNRDKTIEMGRKVVALNPNEPVTLATLAELLAESTNETDPDHDRRLNEAMAHAQRALQTVDTDLLLPPGATPEKIAASKNLVRSIAYEAIAVVNMARDDNAQAEANLKQALDLNTMDPDPVTWLRYAVVLDHLNRYQDALTATNRALQLSPSGSPQATMAAAERDRLLKLTGAATATQPAQGTAPR